MTTRRTSAGRVITDADIEALTDEAERGYDPAELVDPDDLMQNALLPSITTVTVHFVHDLQP